ncbi:LOW QUALITY PROTEIN: growth-regulating factor 4-like [Cucurbita maxima]|uniref:Growth-regulating factor n=1 Tax=Cucurbita maxima TaxID=3661 RepID=A0A6J1L7M5_CUCMA|nr:LOW QUALITY PROTEIN: growth-regulating factor 4-like [Cucurbita maxima]
MNSSGCGGEDGSRTVVVGGTAAAAAGSGMMGMNNRSPFTVLQWQELEHQALIFKYMMAGLPVPPDLVLPIQKSFESISHRFFHHPTMAYCSFYGKKVDPEPGRCRRTDGKKWRCSKDAYPDSKYCERHMHRGRNRSRKPVESQTMTQSSSTVTSHTAIGSSSSSSGAGSFHGLPLNVLSNSQGTPTGTSQPHYPLDSIPYGIPSKDYRYIQGLRPEAGVHSFFSEASGSSRAVQMDAPMDNNTWPMMPPRSPSFPASKSTENSIFQSGYPPYSFFGGEFASGDTLKQEGQSLQPFFDEWPKTRESWTGLDDERSNQTSYSTTQLSISIPMASSDLSTTSSKSPHDN